MHDRELLAWFEQQTERHAFSGVALAWSDGEPVFEFAGGLAHRGLGVPVTLDSRFAVASITKMPTAITALRLVDRGLVRLDQPVVDILAEDLRPAALTPEHRLHHLLSHTSGLTNYHDDDDTTWASWLSCWDRIPTYHARRPADVLPLFADLPARAAPGAEYRYCDANFILVGLVIEAVTGRPTPRSSPTRCSARRAWPIRRSIDGRRSPPARDGLPDRRRSPGAMEDEHLRDHRERHARRRHDHHRA